MLYSKDLSIYTSNSSCKIFSTKELDSHTVDKEMHRHSYYQILVLKKGEIRHFLDYSLQESRAPYLSVVFPNQVHQINLSPDAELSLIAFDSSVFCAAIIANELQDYNIDLQARINHIHLKDTCEWTFIQQLLRQIQHLSQDLNAVKKMEVKFLIKLLLLKSIDIAPSYYPLGKSDSDVQFYVRFRELVNKNFHQQYKVQDYAAELGISTKTLNALCRRYTGKNPLDEIEERGDLLPKSELQEAITYLRNEWNAVLDIFKYGDTFLDNNQVERLNRYISISRRNSLFFGSHKGAERGAILYTIALTCRMHKVNLFEYLTDVINRTADWQPNTPLEKYRELLPDIWKKANE